MIFALGKILTTIALSIGTVGAIGCLVLGVVLTINLYWSLWKWLMGQGDRSPGG